MAKSVRKKKRRDVPNLQLDVSATVRPSIQTSDREAFSGWPMIFAWLGMIIFAFHACTHMVGAGDTWVAMACGRHFLNHGVDTVEPFSANSHKPGPTPQEVKKWPKWARWLTDKVGLETVKYWHPTGWINQNWLTHLIFYWLTNKSPLADGDTFPPSFNALVYWKVAIYIITVICVYYIGRLLGANAGLCAVFACFAMFIGRSFFDIRPAGFSNMLVAVFLLILVLATYRNILYIWLIVPLTVFWCNVHGGYIYAFLMLIPFIGLHLLAVLPKKWTAILYNVTAWPFFGVIVSKAGFTRNTFSFFLLLIILDFALIFLRKNLVCVERKGIYHAIAAYVVAFLAMVLFNPFHLTNLTHTFVISVSKHAARWRDIHEWHPAFDWKNPVGTAVPFLVMFIMAGALLALWVIVLTMTYRSVNRRRKRKTVSSDEYQWPKVDLPLMVIAALTIYMAIRSRRFIPIAAIAACPLLALFINQIVRSILAAVNFHKRNHLTVSPMPKDQQLFFSIFGVLAVLFFGIWWGLKFKRIYLDAWPTDAQLTSVFMRMTASDAKPFYAGQFIKANKLKGKMFNYWTEGGFIAWAQEPDPNTGKTPLQLFMDGRAQAAYDRTAFDLWTYIMSGGPTVEKARARRRELTSSDYVEIGKWVDEQLKRYHVWVVLMPAAQFDSPFVRGLEYNPNWRLAFFNNKQRLFVDITTAQGKELFNGIFTGKTIYPNEFTKNLILAHTMFLFAQGSAAKKQALEFAIKAFQLNPSPAPMVEIILVATRYAELKPRINEFCKDYVDQFVKNQKQLSRQHSYRHKVEACRLACAHLRNGALAQNDTERVHFYDDLIKKCEKERDRLFREKRW